MADVQVPCLANVPRSLLVSREHGSVYGTSKLETYSDRRWWPTSVTLVDVLFVSLESGHTSLPLPGAHLASDCHIGVACFASDGAGLPVLHALGSRTESVCCGRRHRLRPQIHLPLLELVWCFLLLPVPDSDRKQ